MSHTHSITVVLAILLFSNRSVRGFLIPWQMWVCCGKKTYSATSDKCLFIGKSRPERLGIASGRTVTETDSDSHTHSDWVWLWVWVGWVSHFTHSQGHTQSESLTRLSRQWPWASQWVTHSHRLTESFAYNYKCITKLSLVTESDWLVSVSLSVSQSVGHSVRLSVSVSESLTLSLSHSAWLRVTQSLFNDWLTLF